MITEIRMFSKWRATKDMSIGIGSHSMNPNTNSLHVPKGTILIWDEDSRSGNVWFYVTIDDIRHRGKIECGSIVNLIKKGDIELFNNENRTIIYSGEYLQKLLNN
jgi:hypothetical protein